RVLPECHQLLGRVLGGRRPGPPGVRLPVDVVPGFPVSTSVEPEREVLGLHERHVLEQSTERDRRSADRRAEAGLVQAAALPREGCALTLEGADERLRLGAREWGLRVRHGSEDSLSSVDRLRRQIDFILEVDRAKQILRRSRVTAGDRYENDGEHMWHVALAAIVLGEHADDSVDVGRVVRMLLVHDLVEIDAGDAFLYDIDGRAAKEDAERAAADRIFAILPDDQRDEVRALWEEFEAKV